MKTTNKGSKATKETIRLKKRSFISRPHYLPNDNCRPTSKHPSPWTATSIRFAASKLGAIAFILALSLLTRPVASDAAENSNTNTLERVVSHGFRVEPQPVPRPDFFDNPAHQYNSSPSPQFGQLGPGSTFVAAAGVPVGSKTSALPKTTCETAGNPVVISNGNKIEEDTDFVSNGEAPLHLQRIYNHYWYGVGIFGKHWISNFDFKLTFGTTSVNSCYPRPGGGTCGVGANTFIYAWRPDGRVNSYKLNPADGVFYESKPNPVSKIVKQANGSFVLYGEGNQLENYSSAGYISSVKNAQGIGWTFAYTNTTYP